MRPFGCFFGDRCLLQPNRISLYQPCATTHSSNYLNILSQTCQDIKSTAPVQVIIQQTYEKELQTVRKVQDNKVLHHRDHVTMRENCKFEDYLLNVCSVFTGKHIKHNQHKITGYLCLWFLLFRYKKLNQTAFLQTKCKVCLPKWSRCVIQLVLAACSFDCCHTLYCV